MNLVHKLCGTESKVIGIKQGKFIDSEYTLMYCSTCDFYYVSNPVTDYSLIYNDKYYRGEGADPLVDFEYEVKYSNKTLRTYEWDSIYKIVNAISKGVDGKSWLDFGSGMGGLVSFVNHKNPKLDCFGFEEGDSANKSRESGIKVLKKEELQSYYGKIDIITSIEVLEHLTEPELIFSEISKLLKPGGVFFFTTGNADKFRKNIMNWQYFIPEIHISLFTPKSIQSYFLQNGLEWKKFSIYEKILFTGIIKYKVLKTLGYKDKKFWHNLIPWSLLSHFINLKFGVTDLGYGIKK